MDSRKKTLLQEIKRLLKGPQPKRSIVYFEGEYHFSETLKRNQTIKIITQDQAKAILNEDPTCQVNFVYLTHKDPPAHLTNDLKYEWIRANKVEPVIPEEIKERINPPEGIIIGVCDRKCGELLIELFLGIPRTGIAPKGNTYY